MPLHLIAVWLSLANSPHEHGTWRVMHEGREFRGDWKVTSIDRAHNHAHLASRHRVHFASTTTGDYCTLALEQPDAIYCRNLRSCPQRWNCRSTRLPASAMRATTRSATPSLAVEQQLFARIHQRSLAAALDGTAMLRGDRLRVTVPHRREVAKTRFDATLAHGYGFDRGVTTFETTFSIGPRPIDIASWVTRELEQFTERCTYSAHAASSCMPQPPTCVRR